MITAKQYAEFKARSERNRAWAEQFKKPNGWIVIEAHEQTTCPADARITNEERSAIEVYEFCTTPPEKYFLYINAEKKLATTWTGDKLGDVTFGRAYQSPGFGGFASTRVPVTIAAINGRTYHGTYFKSSGDYARVKLSKGSK
jgi:hypothetical protein